MNINLPTSVKSIDAALWWREEDVAFFFAESFYWKFKRKERVLEQGEIISVIHLFYKQPESGLGLKSFLNFLQFLRS